MNNINQFDWVPFYKELSRKLLQYKNNRKDLIDKVKKIFEITNISLPTLEKDNMIVDIDPFTFFGLFNKKITDSNRRLILNTISDIFGISNSIPTSFDSIPVLNPQNATFYYFIPDRGDEDIQELWELFDAAIEYSEKSTPESLDKVSKYFDLAINKKGNANSKITMGLYWVDPNSFLNLDQRNTWYIYKSGKIPKSVVDTLPEIEDKISSTKYFEIVEKLRGYLNTNDSSFNDFMELSFEAWRYSEQVNREIAATKKQDGKREKIGAAIADEGVNTIRYWLYAPGQGAMYWDEFYSSGIMGIGWDDIGNLTNYNDKSEMRQAMKEKINSAGSFKNDAHATWQFANEMKPGDIVFVKKGTNQIIGRGVVESDYKFEPDRDYFKNIRQVKWTHKGSWEHPGKAVMKALTDITVYTDYVKQLISLFESEDENEDENEYESEKCLDSELKPYDEDKFLEEVYMDKEAYDKLVNTLMKKQNVILQGAPGVGKTFVAKRLAYSIMKVKDPSRVMMVQFHQSYSYEDFVLGYRPTQQGGYKIEYGPFYEFCKSAEKDSEDIPYFFIIDEINRGNISKIFGELFMLIESDKRGVEMKLLYAGEKLSVPKNVYIIGMMNTADRSLAIMDYALRRRFAFFNMEPGFKNKGFDEYRKNLNSEQFDKLIACIEDLNDKIEGDESLGEGFCIGHSYFCNLKETSYQTLSGIVEYEIIPLLKEYWFDNHSEVKRWSELLRSAIK